MELSRCSFSDVPQEIILNIFNALDFPSLRNCESVCKFFNDLVYQTSPNNFYLIGKVEYFSQARIPYLRLYSIPVVDAIGEVVLASFPVLTNLDPLVKVNPDSMSHSIMRGNYMESYSRVSSSIVTFVAFKVFVKGDVKDMYINTSKPISVTFVMKDKKAVPNLRLAENDNARELSIDLYECLHIIKNLIVEGKVFTTYGVIMGNLRDPENTAIPLELSIAKDSDQSCIVS